MRANGRIIPLDRFERTRWRSGGGETKMRVSNRAARLSFYGAAATVTGSRYLLEINGRRILVDCGLFQGSKQLRLRNWAPLPFDPRNIDAVVLTHAHIDHSGFLPVLTGNISCTIVVQASVRKRFACPEV